MGAKWIKISVMYLVIVLAFGLFMHYTIQLQWTATHAHIGVLGWLTTGFIGLIYSIYKDAAETGLAKAQYWITVPLSWYDDGLYRCTTLVI